MTAGRPLPLALYGVVTGLIQPLAPGVLRARARRGKEDPQRLSERLGRAGLPRPEGPLIWLHGASVGESLSLLSLIEAIATARPEVAILVTSGTRTAAELLARWLPAGAIHQFAPVDTPDAARRFLSHWRPDVGVFVESELWPNLLLAARARGVRLALLSAKLSDASLRGWLRAPRSAQALFSCFELVLAQDESAAARLARLGASVGGLADLKFGAPPLPADPTALETARAQIGARPLILAASTHPGEEALVLDAFAAVQGDPSTPLLVIAPRHPERGAAVMDLARARRMAAAQRSIGQGLDGASVYIADTLGELGLWFRLAQLAVLGGGLLPGVGGHNPLEPARLSCPFASGPHVANWASAYGDLWRATEDGPVTGPRALEDRLRAALTFGDDGARRAEAAKAYVAERDAAARSAPARVLDLLP